MPEQKIRADPDFDDVQPFDEDLSDERLGIPLRHVERKAHDGDALHAGARERLDLLFLGHQERRRLVGPKHARWMRIERHRRRRSAALPRATPHTVDDLHVPAMQPVEIPQRQHRIVPANGAVIRKVGEASAYLRWGPTPSACQRSLARSRRLIARPSA